MLTYTQLRSSIFVPNRVLIRSLILLEATLHLTRPYHV